MASDLITSWQIDGKTMEIKLHALFAKPLVNGDKVSPKLDPKRPSTWFDFEVVENDDIIMTLKDEVAIHNLLKLPGFTIDYNAFKFSGPIIGYGQSSLYMFNTETKKGWQVNYGHSTSMVSDSVWQMRDRLISIIVDAVPNYRKTQSRAAIQVCRK